MDCLPDYRDIAWRMWRCMSRRQRNRFGNFTTTLCEGWSLEAWEAAPSKPCTFGAPIFLPPGGRVGRALKALFFRGPVFPAPRVQGAAAVEPLSGFRTEGDQPLSQFLRKGFLVSPYQSPVERLYTAAGVRFNAHHTDPDFLATAFSIPDRLKIRGRTQKYVLRKACAGLLPASILNYGKSFNRLKHDLHLSAVLDEMAERLLSRTALIERGLFNPDYVARLRDRPADRPYSQERVYRLWSLILTEMWSRMYLDARGASPGPASLAGSASQPAASLATG